MQRIRSHKELRVWQRAMDAAMQVFEVSKRFPVEERYSLTDQVRRSSRSIAANTSEAWGKRRYPAAFVAKLYDAVSEAAETRTWLEFARRCQYLAPEEVQVLDEAFDRIIGQLITMASRPDQWTT